MKAEPVMPDLNDLQLFDSCVTLGYISGGPCISSAAELLAIMDRYLIRESLVCEFHARSVYPLEHGNQRLMDMIRGEARLHPMWVIEPPMQPGLEPAEALVQEMLAAGVRAARLRLPMKGASGWIWDELCTVLEAHRVPCFFDFGPNSSTLGALQDHQVDALRDIALAHPQLPMVLAHVMGGLGVHPGALHLIRRVPNMYLDIGAILQFWREVARDLGPERVLFSTGMPFTDPGILVSNIQYARDLDLEAKRLMCGGNLRRLLGGVR